MSIGLRGGSSYGVVSAAGADVWLGSAAGAGDETCMRLDGCAIDGQRAQCAT